MCATPHSLNLRLGKQLTRSFPVPQIHLPLLVIDFFFTSSCLFPPFFFLRILFSPFSVATWVVTNLQLVDPASRRWWKASRDCRSDAIHTPKTRPLRTLRNHYSHSPAPATGASSPTRLSHPRARRKIFHSVLPQDPPPDSAIPSHPESEPGCTVDQVTPASDSPRSSLTRHQPRAALHHSWYLPFWTRRARSPPVTPAASVPRPP